MRFKCTTDTFFLGQSIAADEIIELDFDPTLPTNEKGEPDPKGAGKPLNRHFVQVADDARMPAGPDELEELRAENAGLKERMAALEARLDEDGEKKDGKKSGK